MSTMVRMPPENTTTSDASEGGDAAAIGGFSWSGFDSGGTSQLH